MKNREEYEACIEDERIFLKHNISLRIPDILKRSGHLLSECSILKHVTDEVAASVIIAHILTKQHQADEFCILFEDLGMPDIAGTIKRAAYYESESQQKLSSTRPEPQPSTKQTCMYSIQIQHIDSEIKSCLQWSKY